MAKFCTRCGAPLAEGRKFCVKCGTKLMEAAAGEQAAQKAADHISEKKVPQPERKRSASAQNTAENMAVATPNKQHTSVPENNLANTTVNTPLKNKTGSSKFAIIALCLVILAVIGGVGGFFGFKAYKENNYVQAAAKVQSVLAANQATLQKLESIKAEGYPDNAKALAEEISQSIENLDKASGEFGVAEEPDKYKGMTDNISSVMASEKKLLEGVRFLLDKPGDKEAAGNLTAAKAAIGEIKEAAGKISIDGIDFASCTDLSALEGQLSAYATTAAELERKKAQQLSAAQQEREIIAPIVQFHRNITEKDYRTAYNLLTDECKNRMGVYENWAKGFATTQQSLADNFDIISKADNDAEVTFTLTAVDRAANGQTITRRFKSTMNLVKTPTGWRIAQIKNTQL